MSKDSIPTINYLSPYVLLQPIYDPISNSYTYTINPYAGGYFNTDFGNPQIDYRILADAGEVATTEGYQGSATDQGVIAGTGSDPSLTDAIQNVVDYLNAITGGAFSAAADIGSANLT